MSVESTSAAMGAIMDAVAVMRRPAVRASRSCRRPWAAIVKSWPPGAMTRWLSKPAARNAAASVSPTLALRWSAAPSSNQLATPRSCGLAASSAGSWAANSAALPP